MTPTNIKEAKGLAMKYQTLSLKKITIAFNAQHSNGKPGIEAARILTGFGYNSSCVLCNGTHNTIINPTNITVCEDCIYQGRDYCYQGANKNTYYLISDATTPELLTIAFRARAKHIKSILKTFNK